jgi:nucleoside phosphorylase
MQGIDLAILFALEEEFQVFLPGIRRQSEQKSDSKTGRTSFLFEWPKENPYRCLTTFVGTMGGQDALLVTARLLMMYSPANFVLVGIAGSLSSDVFIGDVVIADQVTDYLQDSKIDRSQIIRSNRSYRTTAPIANASRFINSNEARTWTTVSVKSRKGVAQILGGHGPALRAVVRTGDPKVHIGHIASGPFVSASKGFSSWLRKTVDRKFLAVEMESAGFLNAADELAEGSGVMVIRGISDMARESKARLDEVGKGALRRLAMQNALGALRTLAVAQVFERSSGQSPSVDGCRLLTGSSRFDRALYGDIQREFREKVYATRRTDHRCVRVLGFTYAVFWTMMREILSDPNLIDWTFDLFCISPRFVRENASLFAEQWLEDSQNRVREMRDWFSKADNQSSLSMRNVRVRLQTFNLVPFLHGKDFGDGTIFFHSAQWDANGRLSYPNTFHEIVPDTATSSRASLYRQLFDNWIKKYDRSVDEHIYASEGFNWEEYQSQMNARLLKRQ